MNSSRKFCKHSICKWNSGPYSRQQCGDERAA